MLKVFLLKVALPATAHCAHCDQTIYKNAVKQKHTGTNSAKELKSPLVLVVDLVYLRFVLIFLTAVVGSHIEEYVCSSQLVHVGSDEPFKCNASVFLERSSQCSILCASVKYLKCERCFFCQLFLGRRETPHYGTLN